jgi:serine phosphatase RsbU (regulator of sigma subunit)/HAMP domain-containing protein
MLRDALRRAPPSGQPPAADRIARATSRFFSLRLRLLCLIVLVIVPWLGLVLYTQSDERRVAIAHVNSDAMRLIRIATSNQAAQIEAASQLLKTLVRLPQLTSGDAAACSAFLAEMLAAYPLYLNLARAEADGTMSCSAVQLRSVVNVADRPYFKRAIDNRGFAVGDYQIGRVTHLPAVNYAQPVIGAAGRIDAVVFVAQSLDWLTAALTNLEFPPGAVLVVTDSIGTVLAQVPSSDARIGQALRETHVLANLSSQPLGGVFEADDAQGVVRLWAHAPLIAGLDMHATIGVPKSVALADINDRLIRNLAGLGLVTALAVVAAWFGSKIFILRQVDALVAATQRLAEGELETRAPLIGGRSELQLLAHSFNAMATTLEVRDRDLRIAEERARQAEVELAVTRAHMQIAREIQRSLLPEDPLFVAGMQVAGRCIPAVAVGGDYFGYFPRGVNGVDSFIGDVSGHGIGAALLMAEARTIFLAERLVSTSAAPLLGNLNDLMYDDLDRANHFMSACCATFDAVSRKMTYANAGHPPALLLRAADAACTTLDADGMLLGTGKAASFTEVTIALSAGDIVIFYTDGITEAFSNGGEPFGISRLGDAVVSHRAEDPGRLIDGILAAVEGFAGEKQHDDDMTIVAMKVA